MYKHMGIYTHRTFSRKLLIKHYDVHITYLVELLQVKVERNTASELLKYPLTDSDEWITVV